MNFPSPKRVTLILVIFSILFMTGCSEIEKPTFQPEKREMQSIKPNGVYYEIFVRSFADSNSDGIGDLKGVTEKLDYLADLGIEGIWLMPVHPSPSYHGYDVTDYLDIHPDYGSLEDMKEFVKQAHKRDINVIIDLVINHTSNRHPWFQKASTDDPKYKDYYVWSNENTNLLETGEWGQKVWHGSGKEKYEGIFWDGMPDLNLDSAKVREEIIDIATFWLEDVQVDGFRLDAAKHIYSPSDSEHPEEKNHQWWREFRQEMEQINPDVMLVGEVWDAATVVAPYLDDGLTSAFNFDLSEKILESVQSEKDAGIVSSLVRTREYFQKISNGKFIDSTFITNHDMPRVMTEVKGNEDHAKMAASLLLTLPGNPFIYYGEETGLEGSKPDEEIREPFIWSNDKNASEQTNWRVIKHNKDMQKKSVESQVKDVNSMFNHYRNMIQVRRSHPALIKGEIESALTKQSGMVIFKRMTEESSILVLHNLTKQNQNVFLHEKESVYSKLYDQTNEQAEVKKEEGKVKIMLPPYSTIILEEK
ncbi:alpha-amylase family glycosyl hydrolase [Lederbergia sp. NSJ-179]|uniref:alpha-amylase family glycosyl hydrolase n=1 Tax=Lederbergia sp. NSJ-179 TaxID=2931402 RepID=UPI001FCFAB02|nr:alpha-amylase family glycosyl hydrolase [Lederbergia sp. NSJ-179]MCJ7840276.1 alpha-amylase family glycosyl hydrolase [Lederbergia sp. NSJ-179]